MRGFDSRRAWLKGATLGAAVTALGSRAQPAPPMPAQGILDVVIIGAGLAGLTAARDLRLAGCTSMVVLEARDRVGGRTLNHQLPGGEISEAGGQWIGPGQTAIADLGRQLHVDTFLSEYAGNAVYTIGGATLTLDTAGNVEIDAALERELDRLCREVPSAAPWNAPQAQAWDRMTLADWLKGRSVSGQDLATLQVASFLTSTAMSGVSFLYFLSLMSSATTMCPAGPFQGVFAQRSGGQETRFVGGSQILSLKIATELARFVRVGEPVLAVENWDGPVVTVRSTVGTYRCRRVILALSPSLGGQIHYTPELPTARQQIHRHWPAHAPYVKTAMVYPEAFWFRKGYNGQVGCDQGPLIWSYDNSPPSRRLGVINAFVRIAELPEDETEAGRMLCAIYADRMKDDRFLRPLEFHIHDWGKDPYTVSCMSPMPPGLLTSDWMPRIRERCGALHWSGTETSEVWPGWMDGAVRSGHRAALEVLGQLALQRSGERA